MDDFNNQNNQNNGQQDYYSQYNSNQPDYNNQPDYSNQYNNQYGNGQPDYSNQYNNQYGNGQPDYSNQYNNQYNYNNQPYYQPQQYPQYVEQQDDGAKKFAIASLVLGIVSFFCCGTICSVLGLIFGIISKSRQKDNNGMAIAGIVLSSITLVLSIIGVVIALIFSDSGIYYYL